MGNIWRPAVGPLITIVTVAAILLCDRYLFTVPNPGAISFIAVVLSAYLGGFGSGLLSAAISVAYAVYYFSIPGEFLQFKPDNLARIIVVAFGTPAIAIMVGALRRRAQRSLQREREARREIEMAGRDLRRVHAALDEIEDGIVLLDPDLRAQFINRAFRSMWRLPDEVADSKPAFGALMSHGRKTRAYAVSDDELDAYVAQRVAKVRAGDETLLDLRLANGQVIRFKCKVLPDGGRMLSYVQVTDLVQHADELENLATTDGMTSLLNRRHFLTLAETEWGRCRRYERPLSLLMLDIDFFKSINDRFGHDVGDAVIVEVAKICQEARRGSDLVARIGGEEFAVLLPETDVDSAAIVAESVRSRIAERVMHAGAERIPLSVSVGVADASPGMIGILDLLKRADEALYAAKRRGRNQTVVASRSGEHIADGSTVKRVA